MVNRTHNGHSAKQQQQQERHNKAYTASQRSDHKMSGMYKHFQGTHARTQ